VGGVRDPSVVDVKHIPLRCDLEVVHVSVLDPQEVGDGRVDGRRHHKPVDGSLETFFVGSDVGTLARGLNEIVQDGAVFPFGFRLGLLDDIGKCSRIHPLQQP